MAIGYVTGLCYTQSNGKKRYDARQLENMSMKDMNNNEVDSSVFRNDTVEVLDENMNVVYSPVKDSINEYFGQLQIRDKNKLQSIVKVKLAYNSDLYTYKSASNDFNSTLGDTYREFRYYNKGNKNQSIYYYFNRKN